MSGIIENTTLLQKLKKQVKPAGLGLFSQWLTLSPPKPGLIQYKGLLKAATTIESSTTYTAPSLTTQGSELKSYREMMAENISLRDCSFLKQQLSLPSNPDDLDFLFKENVTVLQNSSLNKQKTSKKKLIKERAIKSSSALQTPPENQIEESFKKPTTLLPAQKASALSNLKTALEEKNQQIESLENEILRLKSKLCHRSDVQAKVKERFIARYKRYKQLNEQAKDYSKN